MEVLNPFLENGEKSVSEICYETFFHKIKTILPFKSHLWIVVGVWDSVHPKQQGQCGTGYLLLALICVTLKTKPQWALVTSRKVLTSWHIVKDNSKKICIPWRDGKKLFLTTKKTLNSKYIIIIINKHKNELAVRCTCSNSTSFHTH